MIVVERDIHPSVVTLRIDRPEKRNALNAEVARRLTRAVVDAGRDETVRAVVITGTGKAFSAGADLAALQALAGSSLEDNLEDSRTLARLFEAIYHLDKPVVARVNGHAIAGGCGLMAVCDFAVADDRARVGFTEVRIGFVPAIISVYLAERHPESVLRRLFLTGRLIPAEDARAVGLVDTVVPADGLDEAVAGLVRDLVRETSGDAVAASKRLLRSRFAHRHAADLEHAISLNASARSEPECREGVAAFLSKVPYPWNRAWDESSR